MLERSELLCDWLRKSRTNYGNGNNCDCSISSNPEEWKITCIEFETNRGDYCETLSAFVGAGCDTSARR